jgi:hypothetical protein
MPPGRDIDDEISQRRLLKLARGFEKAGDQALAYEQKQVDHNSPQQSSAIHTNSM